MALARATIGGGLSKQLERPIDDLAAGLLIFKASAYSAVSFTTQASNEYACGGYPESGDGYA